MRLLATMLLLKAGLIAQAWVPGHIIRPNTLPMKGNSRSIFSMLRLTAIKLDGDDSVGAVNGQNLPRKKAVFALDGDVIQYEWKMPEDDYSNPATNDLQFGDLLMDECFIDKSAALYDFLRCWFKERKGDFRRASLHVVYPRRFAKTTLLDFIEAAFSPVEELGDFTGVELKNKIASLEKGRDLLNFGMHPVVSLDMQSILNVKGLFSHIEKRLVRAGLSVATVKKLKKVSIDPRDFLQNGAEVLNANFRAKFKVKTKTIVLIDEHDKPFRRRTIQDDSDILEAIVQLYGLGKEKDTGISLLVLCGLTRMVGTGLSQINNLVDVSQKSKFHGLCGISAQEFTKSCSRQLDKYVKKNFKGLTLKAALKEKFAEDWNGFRFGVDAVKLRLNPDSPEGALFSPLDVWEIVQSLSQNCNTPSSRWINTMRAEFEFTSFADKYVASKESGFIELYRNLQGGWVDTENLLFALERSDYLKLSEDINVQKVLFELGLLSVKEIVVPKVSNQNIVRLGPPNWMVTKNAMRLLVHKANHGITPVDLARFYLEDSETGFGTIVASAAREVSKVYRGTGKDVLREYPFQDYLFMELLYRFPEQGAGFPKNYNISFKKYLDKIIAAPSTGKNEKEAEDISENDSEGVIESETEGKSETDSELEQGEVENESGGEAENESDESETERESDGNDAKIEGKTEKENKAANKKKTGKRGGKKADEKGRADIILSVAYETKFEVAFLIELKVAKIEKGDAVSISKGHKSNIKEARAQLGQYTWDAPTVVKVAVSGVWHPAKKEFENYVPFKLSAHYEFLSQNQQAYSSDTNV